MFLCSHIMVVLCCMVVLETVTTSFDVLLGQHAASDVTGLDAFTLCHRYKGSSPAGESTVEIYCDGDSLRGRYLAIVRRDANVALQFCELEVVTASGNINSYILANVTHTMQTSLCF